MNSIRYSLRSNWRGGEGGGECEHANHSYLQLRVIKLNCDGCNSTFELKANSKGTYGFHLNVISEHGAQLQWSSQLSLFSPASFRSVPET